MLFNVFESTPQESQESQMFVNVVSSSDQTRTNARQKESQHTLGLHPYYWTGGRTPTDSESGQGESDDLAESGGSQ